ncbi:SDR family NAD(P)-dependent oxidoreductase [Chloroflexota bacterium]
MKLKGKVALVTGSRRNIGRAITLAIAEEGGDVVLVDKVNLDELKQVAQEISALGAKALPLLTDITDVEAMKQVIQKAEAEFGKVDILVNNAVQRMPVRISDMTLEQWNASLNVNLTGSFICAQAVLPGMKSRKWGRIISFSGISALWGGTMAVPKAGIIGFTRSLAREVGEYHITVNAIAPGSIEVARPQNEGAFLAHNLAAATERAAIKRPGLPEEVASLVAYLCTEKAGYITGQVLSVNGGGYM